MTPTVLSDLLVATLPVAVFLNLAVQRIHAQGRPTTSAQWTFVTAVDALVVGLMLWKAKRLRLARHQANTPIASYRLSNEAIAVGLIILAHVGAKAPYWDLAPRWDASTYFAWIADSTSKLNLAPLALANDFRLAGHPSHAYGLYLAIGQMLFPWSHTVANIQNLALSVLGIYAFWQLLRGIGATWNVHLRTLLTLAFAFNPLYFGVTLQPNSDIPVTVFLLVVLASFVHRRLVWFGFGGLCLCFSKEPGVLAYGLLLLLIAVLFAVPRAESIAHLSIDFDELVSFSHKPLVALHRGPRALTRSLLVLTVAVLPLVVFLAYYLALPKASWTSSTSIWNDSGFLCFGLSSRMFRTVLGEALLMNFNWIPTCVILAYVAKRQIFGPTPAGYSSTIHADRMLRIISLLFLVYLLVHCLYINFLNARYVLPLVPLWLIIAGYALYHLTATHQVRLAGTAAFAALSVAQIWYALDPVSNRFWSTFKIGDRTVLHVGGDIKTDTQGKADGLVYNAQFAALERLYARVNHHYLSREPNPILLFGSSHFWMLFYCLDPLRVDPATLDFSAHPEHARIGQAAVDELSPTRVFPYAVYVAMPWVEDTTASLQKIKRFYDVTGKTRVSYGDYYLDTYELVQLANPAP
ncbi:MAG TPA: hypothetical protein VIV60_18125 [Polyangiaceae bacterium]